MKHDLMLVALVLSVVCSTTTTACEPTALNWNLLYDSNDINKDNFIDQNEWKSLIKLTGQPYTWQNPTSNHDVFRLQVFKAIDQNQDGKLSSNELSSIYSYLNNPCANFPYEDTKPTLLRRFLNLFR